MIDLKGSAGDRPSPENQKSSVRLIVVLGGKNDIEFLRRISLMFHVNDESFPNLSEYENNGELIFIPMNGGDVREWAARLAPLRCPEFHVFGQDVGLELEIRRDAVKQVNQRERCLAVVARKRSLENYLHPEAVFAARQVRVYFEDFDCVPELAARELYAKGARERPWEWQSHRSQRRMTNRARQWLNTDAVDHMTVDLLRERDPDDEIRSWMLTISRFLASE